ncbi:MAG: hypothetical protein WC292_00135 [Clostridia bacterium]
MKVFTNNNFATGKAGGAIGANRIVGLDTTTGDVIQANATTYPIGVSHNYAQDAGFPITVLPIGAGFARVTAGESLSVSDLGASIVPDKDGLAIKGSEFIVGVLAGLSADVEGATSAAKGDDVVVLLTGVKAAANPTPESKGTLQFVVVDGTTAGVKDIEIEVELDGGKTLTGTTDEDGVVEFVLEVGDYTWEATSTTHTYDTSTDSATVVAFRTVTVDIVATVV